MDSTGADITSVTVPREDGSVNQAFADLDAKLRAWACAIEQIQTLRVQQLEGDAQFQAELDAHLKQNSELRDQLQAREQALADTRAELDALNRKQSQLEQKKSELEASLQDQAVQQSEHQAGLQDQLQQQAQELEQRKAELEAQAQALAQREAELDGQAEAHAQRLEQERSELSSQAQQQAEELERQRADLQAQAEQQAEIPEPKKADLSTRAEVPSEETGQDAHAAAAAEELDPSRYPRQTWRGVDVTATDEASSGALAGHEVHPEADADEALLASLDEETAKAIRIMRRMSPVKKSVRELLEQYQTAQSAPHDDETKKRGWFKRGK